MSASNNAVDKTGSAKRTQETEQYVLNLSYDNIYQILMTGLAAYNLTNDSYDRIQIDNATGGLKMYLVNPGDTNPAATGTPTTASITTSSTSVLAANANRRGATMYNESGVPALLCFETTATLTTYAIPIAVGGYYELPFDYLGGLSAITSSGTAVLRITELT